MALADYFGRNATAAAQIMRQFNERSFRERVRGAHVGLGFGREATSAEGRALVDLVVRLLARLYPTLTLRAGPGGEGLGDELAALARSINPRIELDERDVAIQIAVGRDAPIFAPRVIHAGSDGWDASVSTTSPQIVGTSTNPLGAGAAACLACANVFRALFLDASEAPLDRELTLSVFDLTDAPSRVAVSVDELVLTGGTVLVGLGAIGNAAAWALARASLDGQLHLVDDQAIERSNLQRYVLARRADEGRRKVDVIAEAFQGRPTTVAHPLRWAEFVEQSDYRWARVLVALDSARDRRSVQAALPQWIANAWTQPGDLGLSVHTFDGPGACLACLYLPHAAGPSEDAIIANALRIPERIGQVRELLYRGAAAPPDLLEAIADKLGVPAKKVSAFAGRPIRELYVDGICGGAVLPLGQAGAPRQEVHVPLAHQSALAGVLLAGALVAEAAGRGRPLEPGTTLVTRINVLRPLGTYLTQPSRKDPREICICQDPDYLEAYRRKYTAGLEG